MTEICELIQRIKSVPCDNKLYLLKILSENGGLFALNGNAIYLVPNMEHCTSLNIQTEYLHLETGIFVSAFNENAITFKNGFYNYIEFQLSEKSDCDTNFSAIVNLCASHSMYMGGQDFISFFNSLVSLFQLPSEQNYKNLVGLYGELLVIDYFFENYRKDISGFWHNTGLNSKIDFVLPEINIEVKTTITDQLLFNIKHNQLFENTKETYLAAVSIIENNSGITLDELINKMLRSSDYCNDLNFAINIETERRRISLKEASYKRFCLKSIKLFDTRDICPFSFIPETVSDLSYKINIISLKCKNIQTVVDKIK